MPPGTLAEHLTDLIRATGPISIARYMAEAMSHPRLGYYMSRDPIGLSGDFVTAPEVSQMFGELIGLWCATVWDAIGRPDPVILAELGPGRGTLMADALRAAARLPGFIEASRVHLVETSPNLREKQRAALEGHEVSWHENFDGVPDAPLLLVANELFDALPIRQFERTRGGWCERLVDTGPACRGFHLVLGAPSNAHPVPDCFRGAPLGTLCEVSPAGLALAETIGARVARDGGAALIVDYGARDSTPGETLQSVRGHKGHDVFEAPGEADICAHVDFGQLREAARRPGAAVHGPVEQGRFLQALGIGVRAAALAKDATPADADAIRSGLARLTDPAQMGSLFKVLAISHPDLIPPGFEDVS